MVVLAGERVRNVMVNLFPQLKLQAEVLTKDVREGKNLLLAGRGRHLLFQQIASNLNGQAVVVELPRNVDGYIYAMLSLVEQCEPNSSLAVADQLVSLDIEGTLATAKRAMAGRCLLVNEPSFPEVQTQFDRELTEVFRPESDVVESFLRGTATVRARRIYSTSSVRVDAGEPGKIDGWDSAKWWILCNRDIEIYSLAASSYLLGHPLQEEELSTSEDVARLMWEILAEPLRTLMELLIVHARPMPRDVLQSLVRDRVIERALDSNLIGQTQAGLTAPSVWLRAIKPPHTERAHLHRNLAEAFRAHSSPLSSLAACRHYAAIPDRERARAQATFCVPFLLQIARQLSIAGRDDLSKFDAASQTYDALLQLDQDLRDQGKRKGIGDRPRSYAVHYRAYNRYKASRDQIEKTILSYREALTLWRENALFWSRTVGAYFIAGNYKAGVRALADSFSAVPAHPNRDACLVERTVRHLVKRNLVGPAMIVWGDRSPTFAPETYEDLVESSRNGWKASQLWSPMVGNVWFAEPLEARLDKTDDSKFHCELDGVEGVEEGPSSALRRATEALHSRLLAMLMDPVQVDDPYVGLVSKLDLERLAQGEEAERYLGYFAHLYQEVVEGSLAREQHSALLSVLRKIHDRIPNIRHPAIGQNIDGLLELSWSFADIPNAVFTIEILQDGRLEWFFQDTAKSQTGGTDEEPVSALPEDAILFLEDVYSR